MIKQGIFLLHLSPRRMSRDDVLGKLADQHSRHTTSLTSGQFNQTHHNTTDHNSHMLDLAHKAWSRFLLDTSSRQL